MSGSGVGNVAASAVSSATRVINIDFGQCASFDSKELAERYAERWCNQNPGYEWMADCEGDIVITEESE